jgi:hypothetical protein
MEPYPNRQLGSIDDPDRQSGSGSVPTCIWTRSDGPDPLLTLNILNALATFIRKSERDMLSTPLGKRG